MTDRAKLEASILRGMDSACSVPMRWGSDDCALWCGNIIKDALGYDPCKSWRGRYQTRDGAGRVLGNMGLGYALRAAAYRHGWVQIDPDQAEAGDVGLLVIKDVPSVMICRRFGWFVGRNETGCTLLPARAIRICWSVL